MSYIDKDIENQELSAELLIETYFPDVKEWKANYGSFFSRNYTGDLKSVNPNMHSLSLSRNGIYDILPEKMFFDVEELRFKESREMASRISEIYEEEKNIKDYFLPFDSFFFNQSLRLHKVSSHIVDHESEILLKLYYDYDIEAEENKFVRQLAPSLLHVVELRSDLDALANMLTEIVQCQVDYNVVNMETILFTVHKQGFSSKEYNAFMNDLKPLFDFLQEWFLPMEMECVYKVKDYAQPFVLSSEKALVLDYNTKI